ncbi:MAG: ferritin-like domain-containing protein [Vulcanimicrobiota bacterium]
MPIESFEDLLNHVIGDLLSAEQQLLEALPEMAEAAEDKKLKQTFLEHLEETRRQVQRLEKATEIVELKASGVKTCKAMKGLLSEARQLIKDIPHGPLRDAAMIGAAQRVEHYEMAAYGTARAFAELLEETDIVRLLSETYREEVGADQLLTRVAQGGLNQEALEQTR